ncbi:MAG: tetratricopeptide repeat protein [Terriglobales bacterium]
MKERPEQPACRDATQAPLPAASVQEELQRILASPTFLNARRPSQFLRFIVDGTLAGEDRLKEYLIGVEVFDRPQDYDPKDDPVVRIEAGRLRKKLAEYYAGPGVNDSVVIELPKGGYVPVFYEQPATIEPETTEAEMGQQTTSPARGGMHPGRNKWFRKISMVAGALAAIVIGGGLYHRSYGIKRLTEKDTIVLSDFTNTTGDEVFDGTLKTALLVALKQSPFLNVLPDSKVTKILKQMTLPANTKLTGEVARELCQRADSKAYIAGAIASLGSEYVLQLKAVDCQSGRTLAEQQGTAASRDKVINVLGHAASRLRVALGESLNTVQRFDTPLAEATTPSLEALKAFSLGRTAVNEKGEAAALPFHLRAIELDPRFATAYRAAGSDYDGMGENGRAAEYYTKAFQLREHATEQEKLLIAAPYYQGVTGELDKAVQTYQEQIRNYPNAAYYTGLGNMYLFEGEYEKALEAHREDLRRRPDIGTKYRNLAITLVAMQRFDEARHIIQQAHARNLDDFGMREVLYALAFFAGDSSAMAEQRKWFAGAPEENYGLSLESDTAAYAGQLGKARELTKQSVDSAIHADSKETAAGYLENAAIREAAFGNIAAAKQAAAAGRKLDPESAGVSSEAALAFAMVGDSTQAKSLIQELNQRFPVHTQMQAIFLPPVRAQLALKRGNSGEAIKDLQAASPPIEFALIPFTVNASCLYPTYIRGEAYLAAGEDSAAAGEFQKILDHDGIVWNCWTGALAHLGVARANALESKSLQGAEADAARARALAAYKDFLKLWKDADPNVPIYKAAKAEYAKLQ